jgi:hypothetical protein
MNRHPMKPAARADTIAVIRSDRSRMVGGGLQRGSSNARWVHTIAEIAMRRKERQARQNRAKQPSRGSNCESATLHSSTMICEQNDMRQTSGTPVATVSGMVRLQTNYYLSAIQES